MERTELAVWRVAGAAPEVGVVLARTSPSAKVSVRWEDGRETKVSPRDPVIRFAFQDSIRLKWLLAPDSFDEQFRRDPLSVFIDALRDVHGPATWAQVCKLVSEVHGDPARVKVVAAAAKKPFNVHPHVQVAPDGKSFTWSDEAYGWLKGLSPNDALTRLLSPKGIPPEHIQVLADVVRSGFCNH